MPIVIAANQTQRDAAAHSAAAALAGRLQTQTLAFSDTNLVELAQRVHESAPLLVVISNTSAGDHHRIASAIGSPVLNVPQDDGLGNVLERGLALRVIVALEYTAKADEPVLRLARTLRTALRCNLTLLCAESASESVIESLTGADGHDLAIISVKSLDGACSREFRKPVLVVPRAPTKIAQSEAGAATAARRSRRRAPQTGI